MAFMLLHSKMAQVSTLLLQIVVEISAKLAIPDVSFAYEKKNRKTEIEKSNA